MKNIKIISFILISVVFLPFFSFACTDKNFNDIPYSLSSMTAEYVLSKVNKDRIKTISEVRLKLKLKQENTYTFYTTKDESIKNKTIKEEIITTLGKENENPSLSTVETTTYINGVLNNKTIKTYVKKEESGYTTNSLYTQTNDYFVDEQNKEQVSTTYYKEDNYSMTFSSLFNKSFNQIEKNQVDIVYEKEYDETTYYKLQADTNGLGTITNDFGLDSNLYSSPKLFYRLAKNDYVMPFSCEYGFKEKEGNELITYATIDYSIQRLGETYLKVSSKTTLEAYGEENVKLQELEDEGIYISNTFITDINAKNSFISYKLTEEDTKTITSTQIKKSYYDVEENKTLFYNNYSFTVFNTDTNFYYLEYDIREKVYTCYLLNKENKTKQIVNNVEFDLKDFDFEKKYKEKVGDYYQFGDKNSYINISVEKSKVKIIENNNGKSLIIKGYGEYTNSLNLILDISDYSLIS